MPTTEVGGSLNFSQKIKRSLILNYSLKAECLPSRDINSLKIFLFNCCESLFEDKNKGGR